MTREQIQAIDEMQDLIHEAMEFLNEGDISGALEVFGDLDPADYTHLLM